MNKDTNKDTDKDTDALIHLTREEVFDLAMKKIHANVFFVQRHLPRKTIHVPDYNNIAGYILTNDKELPEYREKIRILNEIMPPIHDTNEYEQCFLVYLIFYIFLFPELEVVQNITFALKKIDKNQIKYYQIQFKDIVEKLKLTKNKEIERIVQGFPDASAYLFEDNMLQEQQLITGGMGSNQLLIIIIIILIHSISGSAIGLSKLLTKPYILQNNINEKELKDTYNKIFLTLKDGANLFKQVDFFNKVNKNINDENFTFLKNFVLNAKDVINLFKQVDFFNKVNKNKNAYEKILTNNNKNKNSKKASIRNIDVGKIINFISNAIDTVKLTNALNSNLVFSFIVDTKKVGKNLYEILSKQYDFTVQNTIVLLGNMSKLALYAGSCLEPNIVLLLESTNALGSLSNTLTSTLIFYEIHKDAIKTFLTLSKEEQKEILDQISFLGGKRKTRNNKNNHNNKKKTRKHPQKHKTSLKTLKKHINE
jgi:hypothetical protein